MKFLWYINAQRISLILEPLLEFLLFRNINSKISVKENSKDFPVAILKNI
jgi:hypothetical protein